MKVHIHRTLSGYELLVCITGRYISALPGRGSGVAGELMLALGVGECGSGLSSGDKYCLQYSEGMLIKRSITYTVECNMN